MTVKGDLAGNPDDVGAARMPRGDDPVPDVSVVVPTYNEAENVPVLVERLHAALADVPHEIVVVDDDSPDRTWEVAEALARVDDRVKVVRRRDAKGLSSAVVAGMLEASGRTLAVIDADLQHDEAVLPEMVARALAGADVVVASREAEGGGYGTWNRRRRFASWVATKLAHVATRTKVTDPMSGYFVITRGYFEATVDEVNPRGFKILLEFLTRGSPSRVEEVGYEFRERLHGETKFSSSVVLEYLVALIDLRTGWVLSPQYLMYALVGISGIVVNLVGYAASRPFGVDRVVSVLIGVELSILWNYLANDLITFRAQRFGGRSALFGLGVYQLVSMHGLLVQLAVFQLVRGTWPFAEMPVGGGISANAFAIAVASVGNYFLHSSITWQVPRPMRARVLQPAS